MRARGLAFVVVMVAACGGDDDGAAPDARVVDASSGAPDAPAGCATWTLEERTITALTLLDPAPLHDHRTLRVQITVELGACEEIAMNATSFAFEAPDVSLTTRAWVPHGTGCAGEPRTVTRPVVLHLPYADTWTIRAAGVTPLAVDVTAFPDEDCNPKRFPCEADCDCDVSSGERCLGYDAGGIVGPTTICARPCEVDRDCGGTSCAGVVDDGISWACNDEPECGGSDPCPVGWTCGAECTADFTLSQSTRGECACDADCAPGLRCVVPYDTAQPNRCQAVCETDGFWCQGPHVCGALGQDLSGLAGTDSVCGWVGE
jgi:hypothetical protein